MPTLQFKGKNIIWNHHLSVPYHTLEEVEELHFQPEKGNGNLIIEGDNLIALKALLPEYAGKVKCIYIDPPYNTGNDNGTNQGWVYNDNVNSPMIKEWLNKEVGSDDLTKHDKWLCMMTPRLKMLRELLSDDGIIFISIDDYALHTLRFLMNEIFGEQNYIYGFTWVRKKKGSFLNKKVRKMTENILVFSKIESQFEFFGEKAYADKWQPIVKRTNTEKELLFSANTVVTTLLDGIYVKGKYEEKETSIEFLEDFEVKDGVVITYLKTKARYVWTQDFLNNEVQSGSQVALSSKYGFNVLRFNQDEKFKAPSSLINSIQNVGTNEDATSEIANLFGTNIGETFDYAKPVSLIKYLLQFHTQQNDLILDSFAGSGTTLQAVNELNKEDGGNRKCILVQMKEDSETQPDKNICQNITRERNKLAIEKLGYESGFKYLKVGTAIDPEKMLEGQLPTYEQFAKYIYYLGTGEHLAETQNINPETHFVGTHGAKAFYLIYEQDVETLTRLALNLSIAEDIVKNSPNKRRVIYAPACFLDSDYMEEKQIEFVSIPYNLFERQTN